MDKRLRVLFVGGGSVGHVAPSVAVALSLASIIDCDPVFLCAWRAGEKEFIRRRGFAVRRVMAPKFPRGFTVRWIIFPMLFPAAFIQSFILIVSLRPRAVFSKGGYVSVPVCLVASLFRIPIVLHESDAATGLGNKLVTRLAKNICHGFPRSVDADRRHVFTGNPVRDEIAFGDPEKGLKITGFSGKKPVLLVIGGSQGAESLNQLLIDQIALLLPVMDIVHLTGPGKSAVPGERNGYWHADFVDRELPHLYALADLVVTRAGAGVLSELAIAGKPAVVVPLEGLAGNHQLKNAQILASTGSIRVLRQSEGMQFAPVILKIMADKKARYGLGRGLKSFFPDEAARRIADVLLRAITRV